MKAKFIFMMLLLCSCTNNKFEGYVYDYDTENPINNVFIDTNGNTAKTDSVGYFCIQTKTNATSIISLRKEGYFTKKIYRKPDSLGKFRRKESRKNKIYLYDKESDFSIKRR